MKYLPPFPAEQKTAQQRDLRRFFCKYLMGAIRNFCAILLCHKIASVILYKKPSRKKKLSIDFCSEIR